MGDTHTVIHSLPLQKRIKEEKRYRMFQAVKTGLNLLKDDGKPIPFNAFQHFCDTHTRETDFILTCFNLSHFSAYKRVSKDKQNFYTFKNITHILEKLGEVSKNPSLRGFPLPSKEIISLIVIECGLAPPLREPERYEVALRIYEKILKI